MKDRLSAWMIVSLIVTAGFLGFIVFESDVACAAPTTWYVDDVAGSSGPGDPDENFTSIQDAINASTDGDLVYVYNGTYYENIVVNRSINLTGMNRDNTTIYGNGSQDVVSITSSWVNITGFNITNGDNGIYVNESSHRNTIKDNKVVNNTYGIYLTDSTYNLITYNNISNNWFGIYFSGASHNIISNNSIWNTFGYGIYLYQASEYNTIEYNEVSSSWGWGGIQIRSSNNDVMYNNITDSTLAISVSNAMNINIISNEIYGTGAGTGISIYDSSLINVRNNNITNNSRGIRINGLSSNNSIVNNRIANSKFGLYSYGAWGADGPTDNYIIDNTLLNNEEGIRMENTLTSTILNNTMTSCGLVIWAYFLNYWNTHVITTNNTVNGKPLYYWKNQAGGTIPAGAGQVVLANCTNVIVENQELTSGSVGIELAYTNGTTIDNVNATNNSWTGIYLWNSNDNIITNSEVASTGEYTIWLWYSNGNNIQNNTLINSTDIHLFHSDENDIVDNIFVNCSTGISIWSSSKNDIMDNNLSYCDEGIYLMGSDNNIVGNNLSYCNEGIYLMGSDNNIVGNNISNSTTGVSLWYYHRNNITLNNITDSDCGIFVIFSSCNNITENFVSDNVNGIWLYWEPTKFNNITYNTLLNNQYGIWLSSRSTNNNIIGNNISKNDYGIHLEDSDGNNITKNTVLNNQYGIYLLDSHENNITDCSAINNDYGVYLNDSNYNDIFSNNISLNNDYGFYLMGSSYNLIYHNNILSNFNQSYDDSSFNVWNETYPTGGNYWSDYDGIDLNSTPTQDVPPPDGIGDTSYDIDPNSRDYYPLMDPLIPSNYPPSEPLNPGTTSGDSYVNLTWDPPASLGGLPIIYYRIYRDTVSGVETFYVEVGDILFLNDTGVTNGITYYYNVSAVNLMGEGPLSGEVNATPISCPYAPQNLVAIGEATYVNLTWSPPISDGNSPITNYTIYRDVTPDPTVVYAVIGNVTWYNDTNVAGGIVYYYRVSAITAIGEGALSNEDSAMPLSAPNAPTNLNTTSGDGFVNLSWLPPANEGGSPITWYHIYRDGLLFHTVASDQLWYNDTGVANGVTYHYNVSASNSIGEGSKSLGVDATPMGLPSAPLNLQSEEGYCYVNLSWDAPSSNGGSAILGYNIYRNGTLGIYDTVNQEWYNDTDVVNGITYSYDIAAANDVGEGALSMIDGTPGVPPFAPQNLQAITGDSYVYLTWDVPSDNGGFAVIEYYVYRDELLITTAPGDQLWYNDTSAVNGVTYTYHVSANNSVGEGPRAGPVTRTPMTTPGAPQNLQAAAGSTFIYLTWDAPAENGGDPVILYTVYRDWSYHATVISGLAFNDTNVAKGTEYVYSVSANNSIGEGSQSSSVDATLPATTPSAPQNFQAEAGDGYVKLMWDSPSDTGGLAITEYYIYRDSTKLFTVSADQPWYNDTNVINGITYKYNVSAKNSIGEGLLSVGTNATPKSPPPAGNQPPSGVIGSPLTGAVLTGTVTISGTSSDPEGIVQRVEIKIDDGNWTQVSGNISWSYPWDTTAVPNGGHTISIRAYDGTTYSSETSIPVVVDNPSEADSEPSEEFPLWLLLAIVLIIIITLLIVLLLARKRKEPEEEPIQEEEAGPEDEEEEAAPEMEEEAEAPKKPPPPPPPEEVAWEEEIDEEPPKKLPPPPPPPEGEVLEEDTGEEPPEKLPPPPPPGVP